ncbi:magnesium transporter CorA family protein [Hespellia stercorisuis]|uniref:Magnesium transporter n=1 Tax=Hespellia stercorisuis DSM 15480 TaxID=1121950 RepID=A0A1M6RHG8_9FIRM|nr:magnesium transporter CorA family protein [Hespellia stercorisuis]SHK31880.1 magnesium transporter [Hespellia stercorisuis DSM 15480]
MIQILKTDNGIVSVIDKPEDGTWINMVAPTIEESEWVASLYDVDVDDIRAALDDEESSRLELEDGYTLLLVDIPFEEMRNDRRAYTTIPLGIILVKDAIITICREENRVLSKFLKGRIREFSTKKRMRFIYQILLRSSNVYQIYLRVIDKQRTDIEHRAGRNETEDDDLIALHELESNLVYFATSLGANRSVFDRLTRYKRIRQYPEDMELLDDVIVENKQAIEMTNIYRDIIHGTRDLLSTIINNRLNNVMKYLTSITLVMAIPTIISGIYGMNVSGKWMPLAETPHGFLIICIFTVLACVIALIILKRRKML